MSGAHVFNSTNLLIALAGLAISYLLGFLLHRKSESLRLIDIPSEIKIHSSPVPRVGGIAIFAAFIVSVVVSRWSNPAMTIAAISFGLPLVTAFLIGLADDRFSLQPIVKLMLLLLAAIVALATTPQLSLLIAGIGLLLLILLTNAVNLLDGMNGLAGSVMAISLTGVGVILLRLGDYSYGMIALLVVPPLFGFLLHNMSGKIFMGDAGSLMLGFLAGLLLIRLLLVSSISFLAGLIVLALPLVDTGFVFMSRVVARKPIFQGDLNHTYNILQRRLGSSKIVLAIFCAVAILLAVAGNLIVG